MLVISGGFADKRMLQLLSAWHLVTAVRSAFDK